MHAMPNIKRLERLYIEKNFREKVKFYIITIY